jgi:hypothetical protein
MEETRNAYKILDGKPHGKRLLGDVGIDGMILLQEVLDGTDVYFS